MKVCPFCFQHLPDKAVECEVCGERLKNHKVLKKEIQQLEGMYYGQRKGRASLATMVTQQEKRKLLKMLPLHHVLLSRMFWIFLSMAMLLSIGLLGYNSFPLWLIVDICVIGSTLLCLKTMHHLYRVLHVDALKTVVRISTVVMGLVAVSVLAQSYPPLWKLIHTIAIVGLFVSAVKLKIVDSLMS